MSEVLAQLEKKGLKSDILLSNAGDYVFIPTNSGLASSGNATTITLPSASCFVINVSKYNRLNATSDTYFNGSTDGITFTPTQSHTGSTGADVSQYILVAGLVGSSRTITLS